MLLFSLISCTIVGIIDFRQETKKFSFRKISRSFDEKGNFNTRPLASLTILNILDMSTTPNSIIGSDNKAVIPSPEYLPDTSNSFESLHSPMEEGDASQSTYFDDIINNNMDTEDPADIKGTKRSAANISTSDSSAVRNKQKVSFQSPSEVLKEANAKQAEYRSKASKASSAPIPPSAPVEPQPLLPPLSLTAEQLYSIHSVILTNDLAIQVGLDYSEAALARINSDLAQMSGVGSYRELLVLVGNYILMEARFRAGVPAAAVARSNTDDSRGSSLFVAVFQGALVMGGLSHREALDAGNHSAIQNPADMVRYWKSKVKTLAEDKDKILRAFEILKSPFTSIPLANQPPLSLITKTATSVGYPFAILVRTGDWMYCTVISCDM